MFSKADENNPLLSTPVAMIGAHIAAGLAAGAVADTRAFASNLGKEIAARAELSVTMAELVVQHLQERSHLPRTIAIDDEPKADDATLLLQAIVFLGAEWQPFDGPGDPRGEICLNGLRYTTKAVKGVPTIPQRLREDFIEALAPHLRKL